MKVAVIKLGSRISFAANDTSGANGEARSICRMLKLGGADVHIYTKILKKDDLVVDYTWHNLSDGVGTSDATSYDALVVLNGRVNFFGGSEDPEQLLNYVMINKFCGPVYYLLCDPELTLQQVWPSVQKKPWGEKWSADQLHVSREDIIYLSQPADVAAVASALGKRGVLPADIIHFPFEKFPCLLGAFPAHERPSVDLSYGGTMRGGRRVKKMKKFYFGHPDDISVEMFGKITAEDFTLDDGERTPTFTGSVRYDEMLPKMNEALAHCVIGDPWYERINDVPQRCYESIMSSVVTFIDSDMDTQRRVFGSDAVLSEFSYVSSKEELTDRIRVLKSDTEARRQILADQFSAIRFDARRYCGDFVELLYVNRGTRRD
jgi:hypothetical protein